MARSIALQSGSVVARVALRPSSATQPKQLSPQLALSRQRTFQTSSNSQAASRIYDPIRDPSTLSTHLLLSSSSRKPLITFWTASWCPSCRTVGPILKEVIESFGSTSSSADDIKSSGEDGALVGDANSGGGGEGGGDGVMFAEIEIDSPTGGGEMAAQWAITSVPTLLAFSKGEAQNSTRVTDVGLMKNREWLRNWLEEEVKKENGGVGGGVGNLGGSFLGGLFGGTK